MPRTDPHENRDSVPFPEKLYRPAEVAKMLRCSEWWIKEQARNRRIPFARIGGSYRFTDDHVSQIVNIFEVKPVAHSMPHGTGIQARQPKTHEKATVVRLQARPPRRVRNSATRSVAA